MPRRPALGRVSAQPWSVCRTRERAGAGPGRPGKAGWGARAAVVTLWTRRPGRRRTAPSASEQTWARVAEGGASGLEEPLSCGGCGCLTPKGPVNLLLRRQQPRRGRRSQQPHDGWGLGHPTKIVGRRRLPFGGYLPPAALSASPRRLPTSRDRNPERLWRAGAGRGGSRAGPPTQPTGCPRGNPSAAPSASVLVSLTAIRRNGLKYFLSRGFLQCGMWAFHQKSVQKQSLDQIWFF